MNSEERIAQFKVLLADGLTQAEALAVLAQHGDVYPSHADTARATYGSDNIEIDDYPMFSVAGDGSGLWVSAWVWIASDDLEDGSLPDGHEIRHDAYGFYVCSAEEAEHEDEGNASVGFDMRMHFETIAEAREWFASKVDADA